MHTVALRWQHGPRRAASSGHNSTTTSCANKMKVSACPHIPRSRFRLTSHPANGGKGKSSREGVAKRLFCFDGHLVEWVMLPRPSLVADSIDGEAEHTHVLPRPVRSIRATVCCKDRGARNAASAK